MKCDLCFSELVQSSGADRSAIQAKELDIHTVDLNLQGLSNVCREAVLMLHLWFHGSFLDRD